MNTAKKKPPPLPSAQERTISLFTGKTDREADHARDGTLASPTPKPRRAVKLEWVPADGGAWMAAWSPTGRSKVEDWARIYPSMDGKTYSLHVAPTQYQSARSGDASVERGFTSLAMAHQRAMEIRNR